MIAVVGGLEQVHKLTTSEVRSALGGVLGNIKTTIAGYFGMGTAARTSASVTRTALLSTGLLAFIVLLGVVITNWDKISAAVTRNSAAIKAFVSQIPLIGDLVKVLDLVEQKFGGISQLVSGLGSALVESFSVAGDVLGSLLKGDVTGALAEARKIGTRTSEAFDAGVREKNAQLAEERERESAKQRQDSLKRSIAEAEAAGKDSFELKKAQLQDEILLLDKSATDYQKLLADKQSEIRVLTVGHNKKLADEGEKARKEEADKQKAATEKAQQEAEKRYAALRNAQKEASEKETAANDEERKRRVALARALGGTAQAVLRAEIDAAKDAQVELMLNGKRFGSEYLALQEEIRTKEQQIVDANLADRKRDFDERAALQAKELQDLNDAQFERISRLQRGGASERQLDEQRLKDLKAQRITLEQQGATASRAYVEVLNAISDAEAKLKPKALSVGDLILTRLFGVAEDKLDVVKQKIAESAQLVSDSLNILSDLYFTAQQEKLDAQIEGYNKSLDTLKERGQQIEEDLKTAQSNREALEKDVDAQKGARREATIARIAKERAEEARLAREKAKNDAAELNATKQKEAAEKKKQALEKQGQVLTEASIAITNAATAASAIGAAIEAVKQGAKSPWPTTPFAILAALAAVAAAVASAKKLSATVKGEQGGVLEGPSHSLGGIRSNSSARFANIELEGGEQVVNRRATSNNLDTLATINKYGARVQFVAVPKPMLRAANGGQITEAGGLEQAGEGSGMMSVPTAQFNQMVGLLAQIAGHTAQTAGYGPPVLSVGAQQARQMYKLSKQEEADENGGKLFG
ncbi:hypothetical protein [uncultured Hymenobacter sp.]|uniref:hypothetical protein n=1 Tax=uncultured Hymenobacter sp. TaxID=170016 RepID=UPI0035CC4B32